MSKDATSAQFTNLQPGTTYQARARALNDIFISSAWTSEAQARTAGAGAPVVTLQTATADSLAIGWSEADADGNAITAYKIRWATAAEPTTYLNTGGASGMDASGGASARAHTIPNLPAGTTFQVQVAAVNSLGSGGWGEVQARTTGVSIPVVTLQSDSETSIAVRWDAADGGVNAITGYKVRWATAAAPAMYLNTGGAAGLDAPGRAFARAYTIPGLTSGTAYQVQVAAVNSLGTGGWSAAQSGTPAEIKAVVCLRRPSESFSLDPCIERARNGLTLSKSGGAQEFRALAFISTIPGQSVVFTLVATDDADNPLVANTDTDGALPALHARTITIAGNQQGKSIGNFTITPKTSGDGGRINIGFTLVTNASGFLNLADNQKLGTFLQITEVGMNITASDANGNCPAVHKSALTSRTLAEGGDAVVACVSLQNAPTAAGAPVTVNCKGKTGPFGNLITPLIDVTPAELIFTTANWQTAQAVRISAPDNDRGLGPTDNSLRCTASAPAGGKYDNLDEELALTVTDTDVVSATGGTLTAGNITESGGKQKVKIIVTLGGTIAPSVTCSVSVSIGSMAISGSAGTAVAATPGDYTSFTYPFGFLDDIIQIRAGNLSGDTIVEITPVMDSDTDIESIPLSATIASCGGASNIDFGAAEILITEPGILISEAAADGTCPAAHSGIVSAITLAEGGAADDVCVSLRTDPGTDGPVTTTCTVGNAALVGVTESLTPFTSANWQTAQVVNLRALDNNVAAAATSATDTLTCAGSGSGGYASVSKSVSLTVTDTDAVSATGTLQSTGIFEGGGLQTITITATLGGVVAREDCTVTVTPGSSLITNTQSTVVAASTTDYTGTLALPSITITAGELSGSGTLQLTAVTDSDTAIESIPLSAAAASCGGVAVNFGASEILIEELFNTNVDGSSGATDWKDGVLVARYLLGLRGDALKEDLTVAGSDSIGDITTTIAAGVNSGALDIDGDGNTTAADGIMFARYFFGIRGDALIAGMTTVAAATVAANIAKLAAS